MKISATLPDHGALVMAVMEGFVQADQLIVRAGIVPPFPSAIPGLKFIPEPKGSEEWLLANQVMEAGGGDCEDLAFWECAGLRETGEDAGAQAVLVQTGQKDLHCVVMLSDGSYRDPALMLRAVQSTRRRRMPVRGALGGGPDPRFPSEYVHDHRGGKTDSKGQPIRSPGQRPGAPPPAAAPTGDPAQAAAAFVEMERRKALAQTRAQGEGAVFAPATFGQSDRKGPWAPTEGAPGLTFVQDEQGGDPYWTRGSAIDHAAWDQGISPDELRQQMAFEQQFEDSYGYGGNYPDFSAYGGYPNPYGGYDAYLDSGYGDPAAFYRQQFGLYAAAPDDEQDLGIDLSTVIDVESEEVDDAAA